jgi:hypothetical protein
MKSFSVPDLTSGRKLSTEAKRKVAEEESIKVEERMKVVWGDTYPTFAQIQKLKRDLQELEAAFSKIFLELKAKGGETFEEVYTVI